MIILYIDLSWIQLRILHYLYVYYKCREKTEPLYFSKIFYPNLI